MRTALVHDWLTGMRGGEMVLEAIGRLFPQAPIYTLLHVPGSVSPEIESHPIVTGFLNRAPGIRRHYRRYLPLFPAAVEDFDLSGFDLVISSSHCAAKGVIPPPGSYHVCYCHTPMRYAWDQEHAYFPRRQGIEARLRGLALTALRAWDVTSSARVDLFLANSRFVAERIRRYYNRQAEVLHPPVDTDFFTPQEAQEPGGRGDCELPTVDCRPGGRGDCELPTVDCRPGGLEAPFCLVVAALTRYKRLEVAIEACRRLGLELRIVGTGPEWSRLEALSGPRTRLLGRVDREHLRSLYRGALCLLQPGIEDFGIAPVEALACGTPVVARGTGGVLDIVEDGVHGVLYDGGGEVDELTAAIDRRRKIRFNLLDLRTRAEAFSTMEFLDRLRSLLGDRPAAGGGRP